MANPFLRGRYDLWIGAKAVPSRSGRYFETYNPATGEVLAEVAEGTAEDVDEAVRVARRALSEGPWAGMGAAKRTRLLFRVAELIRENLDPLLELEVRNNGKAAGSAKGELLQAAEDFEFFAGAATKVFGETIPMPSGFFNYTVREPVGVCGQIVPWNYPFMMAAWKVAPALAAGNTVVLKPASATPLTALILAELCAQAGIPEGVVNVVTGPGGTVGAALASHPGIRKIAFTGETETGKGIMRAAAENVTRITLELGGKSPNLVFADADLEAAANGSVHAIYTSAGQSCEARSRLYVERPVYDEFVRLFVEKTKRLRIGDPLDPATQIGAIISEGQVRTIDGYVQQALREGAELLCGGRRPQLADPRLAKGHFYEPTAIAGLPNTSTVVQEEIFGPVVAILPFDEEAEAIRLANDIPFGLAATVWTRDVARAHRVAGRLEAGMVQVNTSFTAFPGLPFGGYKQSGIGRELAFETMRLYTELKSVLIWTGEQPLNPFRL